MATITLTELRQNLFALADRVAETGEPLVIERRGTRLMLVREAAASPMRRLALLEPRTVTIGAALRPDESPASWSEDEPLDGRNAAEPAFAGYTGKRTGGKRTGGKRTGG
jgi:PHD/YefM family antitoxin component YafN of YafNO toxin-antitoxin module